MSGADGSDASRTLRERVARAIATAADDGVFDLDEPDCISDDEDRDFWLRLADAALAASARGNESPATPRRRGPRTWHEGCIPGRCVPLSDGRAALACLVSASSDLDWTPPEPQPEPKVAGGLVQPWSEAPPSSDSGPTP